MEDARAVVLKSTSGRIRVGASPGSSIVVVSDERLVVKRVGHAIHLSSGHDRLEVLVPQTAIEVRSQSGRVDIEGQHDRVEVRTASGRITADIRAGEVELHSLAGSVKVEGHAQRLRAETVSGDISCEVEGLESLRLALTSGDAQVRAARLPLWTEVETVSGDTRLRGGIAKGADIRASSMSGRIILERNNRQGFRLKARARFGSIRVLGKKIKSRSLLQEVDGGGAEVRLSTFSGRIDIE